MLTLVAGSLRFLSPGYLIGDKYSIVQAIGSGGMGIVYEATHTRLGQRVAVKMLAPDLAQSKDAVTRFEREARAAANLRSPHVARVFDVDALSDGTPYIVMELLEGHDLSEVLAVRGSLPVAEAVDYLLQACDAMAEAHHLGIVHRDLKPSNMFLANDGRHTILKVLDFGISKVADDSAPSVTTTRSGLGTPYYMSPEQVRSAKHVDARCDVWALGVVLYEMLTGCQPFMGEGTAAVAAAIVADPPIPLHSMRDDVPPALERVLMTALEKDRNLRFADAAALAAAAAPFASGRRRHSSAPVRASTAPVRRGPVSDESNPSPNSSPRARLLKWSHPRSLWVLAGLGIGVISSAVVVREATREPTPSVGPSSAVLAAPAVTTVIPPTTDERDPSGSPSEIGTAEPADPLEHRVTTTRAASMRAPLPPSPTKPSSSASRSAPASTSIPAPAKETAAAPSSHGATKPKNSLGLPPDPG